MGNFKLGDNNLKSPPLLLIRTMKAVGLLKKDLNFHSLFDVDNFLVYKHLL